MIKKLFTYKLSKTFTKHRKETNKNAVFSHWPLPKNLKYGNYRWDLPTVYKTMFLQTNIEEFSMYENSDLEPLK